MLHRDSPIPLYIQLADDLHRRIDAGEFNHSGRLPTENRLANEYDVSRITVRQAISSMVEKEIVVKKQGKGTFFKTPRIEQNLEQLFSLGEILSKRNVPAQVRILEFRELPDPPEGVRRKLLLDMNDSVLVIQRQHLVDDIPVVCAYIYLSPRFQRYVSREALYKSSIYQLLETQGNVNIAVARQEITALTADDELAEVLGVEIGDPLLCMENVTFTDSEQPIDNTFFYCRPDRYKFIATVRRTQTELSLRAVQEG